LVRDQLLLQNKVIIKLKKHHQHLFLRKKVKLHQILILPIIHQKFQPRRLLLRSPLLKRPPHHQTSLKTARIQMKNQKAKKLFKLLALTRKMKRRKKKEVLSYLFKVSHLIPMNTLLKLILNLMETSPNVN